MTTPGHPPRDRPDAHVVAPHRLGSAGATDRRVGNDSHLDDSHLDRSVRPGTPLGEWLEAGPPDRVVLLGLLLVAAVLRFAFLAGRGAWDADQGHDMLVLHALVFDGRIPLLGPPTSIGDIHHGAVYYYLLAPLAFVSRADPTIVVSGLAAAGTAAVGVVWWLARSIGGRLAGAIAGLLIAVSPSAIEASTFLWNPNAIALTAAIALAGAWRAHTSRRTRWWIVSGLGVGLTMQLHVLGVGLVVPVVGLFIWGWRRGSPGATFDRRRAALAGLAAVGLILALYVPLIVNELTTNFAETRAALAYLSEPRAAESLDPVSRLLIVFLRIVSWPLVGLITDAAIPGLLASMGIIATVAWRWRSSDPAERHAVRWFALSVAWSAAFLTVAAQGLTSVIPGLPNDHYHAFVDPMVFTLGGLGLAAVARGRGQRPGRDAAGAVLVTIALGALLLVDIGRWSPTVSADLGWPGASSAATRVVASAGGRPIVLSGLPRFKGTGAYAFPLVRAGHPVRSATGPDALGSPDADPRTDALVIVCDRLFEAVLLARCGGPAEDEYLRGQRDAASLYLADRFEASPRTVISVYLSIENSSDAAAP